jgi:hypothetical protein
MGEEQNIQEKANPGWYPDPAGKATWRWWDGSAWTNQVKEGGIGHDAAKQFDKVQSAVSGATLRSSWQRIRNWWESAGWWKWLLMGTALIVALSIIGNLLPSQSDKGPKSDEGSGTLTDDSLGKSVATALMTTPDAEGVNLDSYHCDGGPRNWHCVVHQYAGILSGTVQYDVTAHGRCWAGEQTDESGMGAGSSRISGCISGSDDNPSFNISELQDSLVDAFRSVADSDASAMQISNGDCGGGDETAPPVITCDVNQIVQSSIEAPGGVVHWEYVVTSGGDCWNALLMPQSPPDYVVERYAPKSSSVKQWRDRFQKANDCIR